MTIFRPLAIALAIALPDIGSADQGDYARPHERIDVGGGRKMNLFCFGSGSPTVVFESGSGIASWSWMNIQPEIARKTRACIYDRAGLGFSDPSPNPANAANAVADLHRLLTAAAEAPPYVLVGHSSGAITVQLYAYTFPQEVSGLVLVDGSTENETARLDRITGGKYSQSMTGFAALAMTCRDAAQIGALAPGNEHFDDCLSAAPITGLGHALAAAIRGAASLPAQRDALVSELANDPVSAAQLRAARNSFGDLPVACLTRSVPLFTPPGTRQSPASVAAERENKAMHDEIAALSRRGSNRVVPGAGHFIQTDRPQAVIPAIDRVLAEQ